MEFSPLLLRGIKAEDKNEKFDSTKAKLVSTLCSLIIACAVLMDKASLGSNFSIIF